MLEMDAKGRERLTRPEPRQTIDILARHLDVHTPHTTDDIHGENNSTQYSQLAQNISSLLRALIH